VRGLSVVCITLKWIKHCSFFKRSLFGFFYCAKSKNWFDGLCLLLFFMFEKKDIFRE
jgi:hypothetical protein